MARAIHVHTQSDKSTVEYVKFMWRTMLRLASHPSDLRLHVHCIGPSAVDALAALQQSEAHQVERATEGGSFGHAACIMDALAMVNDDAVHVICDSDAFVVARGWDDYARGVVASGVGIAGTTYEDKGGFSSGNSEVQTYKKIPTFTWCVIAPGYPWNRLDVTPKKDHRIHVSDESLSKVFNLPVGHYVFGEAGYQLPLFLNEHRIKYAGWRHLKPSKDAIVLTGLSDYHEEYHATDGTPLVVHHRGSLRHQYRGSKLSTSFFDRVDSWLANEESKPSHWTSEPEPWSQLALPLKYDEPEPQRPVPLPDVRLDGWWKATVDATVVKAKGPLTTIHNELRYTVTSNTHHVRLEGLSNAPFYVTLPDQHPQSVAFRNMTNVAVMVQKDPRSMIATVPANSAKLLLVDVDGIVEFT